MILLTTKRSVRNYLKKSSGLSFFQVWSSRTECTRERVRCYSEDRDVVFERAKVYTIILGMWKAVTRLILYILALEDVWFAILQLQSPYVQFFRGFHQVTDTSELYVNHPDQDAGSFQAIAQKSHSPCNCQILFIHCDRSLLFLVQGSKPVVSRTFHLFRPVLPNYRP